MTLSALDKYKQFAPSRRNRRAGAKKMSTPYLNLLNDRGQPL